MQKKILIYLSINFFGLVALSIIFQDIFFLPNPKFFLTDLKHYLVYPEFWDNNKAIYSILPFSTLICIFLKVLLEFSKYSFLLFGIFFALHQIYFIYKRIYLPDIEKIILTLLIFFSMPILTSIFVGNYSFFCASLFFTYFFFLEKKNINLSRICVSLIICVKFNFFPLFFLNNIFFKKNSFFDILKEGFIVLIYFSIFQIISFFLINLYDASYSFSKILNSFNTYQNDYITGVHGIQFRYWLGSFFALINNSNLLNFEIFIDKNFLLTFFFIIEFLCLFIVFLFFKAENDKWLKLFYVTFACFYLNLATAIYWYSILIPFFLIFFKDISKYFKEIFLIVIIVFPKFFIFYNYEFFDQIFTSLSILIYCISKIKHLKFSNLG